ncbi:MAG: hypothetical protein Q9191_001910, partial [Dirinaria sp. TL-2023a]
MLPPQYKDLWKTQFQEWKADDVKEGRAWMYEADPFAAKVERDEARTLMEKRREDREKQKAKEAQQPISVVLNNAKDSTTSINVTRGWTRVPKVEMGSQTRAKVENLIRRRAVWNPHNVRLSQPEKDHVVADLTKLGFRRSHLEEAVEECKDRDETLEWLLIHVPEDDLPRWSLPENYAPGVAMASANLKREAAVQRLAAAGYSIDLCGLVLDRYEGNEALTAEVLQWNLIKQTSHAGLQDVAEVHGLKLHHQEGSSGLETVWAEEQATLQAIYGDRFTADNSTSCHIDLEVAEAKNPFTLHLRRSLSYPATPPIVSVVSFKLPAHIRLSIIRQAVEAACRDMLGQPMIFNIMDWLETSINHIVENPDKLRDIAVGASSAADATQTSIPKPKTPAKIHVRHQLNRQFANEESLALLKLWHERQSNPRQQKLMLGRQALPAWSLREDIVSSVNHHQVTIISGETGSGKSTQSVQFILDDMIQRKLGAAASILCTQPRRISALGLTDRVSEERCSNVGDEVGYVIRGESRQKAGLTRITFLTTGVLLRRLQVSGGSSKDAVAAVADVSHIVVDEVHERSLDTDFLLAMLRDVLKVREDLKVVLMSATLEAGVFESYFGGPSKVAKIEIQGRTFPVEDFYLDDVIRFTGFTNNTYNKSSKEEDWDDDETSVAGAIQGLGQKINYELIASTVQAIDAHLGSQDGGILIFLPGTLEIDRTLEAVKRIPNVHALPLHASLTPAEQRRVFPLPPRGKRKVVAATNVAETSITIEDIVAVIDLGKVKETSFDPQSNMVKLEEVWASRAACKQRRGRAGRVRAGACYRLYTRNAEAKMVERPEPEIRRVPLEQLCLSIRAMGVEDIAAFLASALTPPENLAVEGAIELLHRMGALDGSHLTALGHHLSMIPADLRCGKLMVYGATFGCLEACLTIAAVLTVKSPFVSPQNKREESKASKAAFGPDQGDLICDLRAFEAWAVVKERSSYRDARA